MVPDRPGETRSGGSFFVDDLTAMTRVGATMSQVVLVHGNPETDAIWEPLTEALAALEIRDIGCLSPPGFGAPVPDGFGATTDDYSAWLVAELEKAEHPVHLVGHDWGGG